jgi:serine/threonine protein kinase
VALPSSICYVGSDAFPAGCSISSLSGDVGIAFDLRMIVNREAILRFLAKYYVDLSLFEREQDPDICKSFGRFVTLYRRKRDDLQIVTKEFPRPISDQQDPSFESLEMLTHLTHPGICPLFGIVSPTESTNFLMARLYCSNGSLKEVIADPPSWWTPTAKSKAIAGIVLGMRFAHSFDCVHGSLKPSNILFDNNRNAQIVDFCSNRLRNHVEVGGRRESGHEEETRESDVFSFSLILFEILVGRRVVARVIRCGEVEICFVDDGERAVIPSSIPSSIRELIERGWSADWSVRPSFDYIYKVLKDNDFDTVEGNEVNEVLRFVSSLEASEY